MGHKNIWRCFHENFTLLTAIAVSAAYSLNRLHILRQPFFITSLERHNYFSVEHSERKKKVPGAFSCPGNKTGRPSQSLPPPLGTTAQPTVCCAKGSACCQGPGWTSASILSPLLQLFMSDQGLWRKENPSNRRPRASCQWPGELSKALGTGSSFLALRTATAASPAVEAMPGPPAAACGWPYFPSPLLGTHGCHSPSCI